VNAAGESKTDGAAAIRLLMSPESIVFVGASADATKQSGQPVRNVMNGGYGGKVFAVNRRGGQIESVPTAESLQDISESIDVGFVTVPAAQCADTIRELGAKGARVAVLAVGGFAETGSETGTRLSREVLAASRDTGVRLVGPVCNGIYNTWSKLALGYNVIHRRVLEHGRVAFISHSGALAGPFVTLLENAGAGLSAYVSAGSELDLGLADFISYFADDAETRVIAIIVDHVGDGQKFLAAVRRARRRGKEIVALKLGNTVLGRAATLAHSSHLSGQKQVYDSIFAVEGIRSVATVERLALTCAVLAAGRHRAHGGVIATSSSGGGAIIMADLLSEEDIPVAPLSPATLAEMGTRLRFDAARIMNPFDLGLGGRRYYIDNVATLAKDPGAAALIVFGTPVPQMQSAEQHAQLSMAAVRAATENADLPVIYLSPAPLFDDERGILQKARIPVCGSSADAVALAKALLPVAPVRADDPPLRARARDAAHAGALSEYQSKALLRAHGVRFPKEELARTLAEAEDAADAIGYPVVLKASGAGIWHKSEHNLLELGIATREDLRTAWRRLEQRLDALEGMAAEGFLVGAFLSGGVEAFLGFSRDREFGHFAILGAGGVLAELFGNAGMRHLPLPLNARDVRRALEGTPLHKLLSGYRGAPPCDIDAFIDLILTAADCVMAFGDGLDELDLNPVKILPRGGGAWPLDALCVFAQQDTGGAAATPTDQDVGMLRQR
jgi:acyl-CoA synthetase (NDP forming)